MKPSGKSWARYAYIGPHLIISTLIGGYIGYHIDGWVGTDQVFMLIFGILGSAAGIINLFRELNAMNRDADAEDHIDHE
ncbi:MAG: AtpZ/AtpI family protein [Acidobacteria bacterium]|nr:AtpZ/AtpI family protein [Acidobacteriota bacterium]